MELSPKNFSIELAKKIFDDHKRPGRVRLALTRDELAGVIQGSIEGYVALKQEITHRGLGLWHVFDEEFGAERYQLADEPKGPNNENDIPEDAV